MRSPAELYLQVLSQERVHPQLEPLHLTRTKCRFQLMHLVVKVGSAMSASCLRTRITGLLMPVKHQPKLQQVASHSTTLTSSNWLLNLTSVWISSPRQCFSYSQTIWLNFSWSTIASPSQRTWFVGVYTCYWSTVNSRVDRLIWANATKWSVWLWRAC